MGANDKILNDIAVAAAEKGLSLQSVLNWIKKHKSKYPMPTQMKIDIAIAIRQFHDKNKKLTPRKLKIQFAQSKEFSKILDKHYSGSKRAAFDDTSQKKWTTKLVLHDAELQTNGAFKRYKVIDNQLLRPTIGIGLISIFWENTVPFKLITKKSKK